MRIGILGGSFNPPHIGHLILAENIREKLNLDKIIFVPANIPPLKEEQSMPDAKIRLRMVNLAIEGNSHFDCSAVEIERGGISYTVDTLRAFKDKYPRAQLFFLAGADVINEIGLWKEKEKIFKLCEFIVVTRKNFKIPSVTKDIKTIEMNIIEISSSEIREKIKQNKSIRYLVPGKVRLFIKKNKLYER